MIECMELLMKHIMNPYVFWLFPFLPAGIIEIFKYYKSKSEIENPDKH